MEAIAQLSILSPQTRLTAVLSANEPNGFAKAMLSDVLTALAGTDAAPTVLVDGRDLALVTPTALERLFEPYADIALAPCRGGGTNAVVVCHPDSKVDYHGTSIRDYPTVEIHMG